MSPIQTVALGVRLFAIWLAIYCSRWAPYFYGQARDADDTAARVVIVAVGVLAFAAVLFLWFFPRTVARAILPAGDPVPVVPAGADAWLAVGCTLLGLWVLSDALPGLARHAAIAFYVSRANMPVPTGWGTDMLYDAVQLVIGAWLVLGAAGVRRTIAWARGRANHEELS
jgi:hypothetical protein